MALVPNKFKVGDVVAIKVNGKVTAGIICDIYSDWNVDLGKMVCSYHVEVDSNFYVVEEKDIQSYSKQLLSQIEVTCPNGKTYLIVNVKKLENLANLEMWQATTSDGETVYISHNHISVMIIKDQPEEMKFVKQCQEIKEIRNEQT